MKASAEALQRLTGPTQGPIRLVLLHGADEAASDDLANQIAGAVLGAERDTGLSLIAGASLTADPSALVAAASTISMFGERSVVRVTGAGEDATAAVHLLLDGPAGNLVVMTAGSLRKGSKLLTLAETSAHVLSHASYALDADAIASLVAKVAKDEGLSVSRDVAIALFELCGGNRGVLRRELEKLALFLDATPERPQALDADAVSAVGAASGEAETGLLVAATAGGKPVAADAQITRLMAEGTVGIVLTRGVTRRLQQLGEAAAALDGGARPAQVLDSLRPPVFWKDKPLLTAELPKWRGAAADSALGRLLHCERAMKASQSAGDVLAAQLLLGLAVQSAGRS